MKNQLFCLFACLFGALLIMSCSNDDYFIEEKELPIKEIAFSCEYESYLIIRSEVNALWEAVDTICYDSVKGKDDVRSLEDRMNDFFEAEYKLHEKYPIFSSLDAIQKEELYFYAVANNPKLSVVEEKDAHSRIITRSSNGDPEKEARIYQSINWSKEGFNIEYYDELSDAMARCNDVGQNSNYGTFGYSFNDNSALLFLPTQHHWRQQIEPKYPNEVLMSGAQPKKLFFFAYCSSTPVFGDINLTRAQKDVVDNIRTVCSSIRMVCIICKRGEEYPAFVVK